MQEWEDFVRDLREEIPDERPDTWIVQGSPARFVGEGGTGLELETWVAHFNYGLVYDKSCVLLEIHRKSGGRNFLAFGSLDVFPLKGKTREQFVARLKRSAQKHGWDVVDEAGEFVPEFMRTVVCRTKNQDCWLVKDANGKLDMQATVTNFLKAAEILRDAVR